MTLDIPTTTDDILTSDTHLIQSFADLNALKQNDARTVIVGAEGAYVTDSVHYGQMKLYLIHKRS